MKETIELDKERSLREIIDDSYLYIKINFREMMSMLIISAGPFLLISQAFSLKVTPQVAEKSSLMSMLDLLLVFVAQTLLFTVNYGYLLFKQRGEEFTTEIMWQFIGRNFLMMLSSFSSVFILLVLGIVALVIPGIYIFVPLSMIYIHRLITPTTFFESFSYLNTLVKGEWWNSFGVFFLTGLVLSAFGALFLIPHFTVGYSDDNPSVQGSIITAFSFTAYYIVTSLVAVPVAMQYFSLRRKKQ